MHLNYPRPKTSRPLARLVRVRASRSGRDEIVYNDSPTDIAFINMCRRAYANIAGWQSPRGWDDGAETYQGMVEVSRALMRGRTPEQQRNAVIAGFPRIPPWFRRAVGSPFSL